MRLEALRSGTTILASALLAMGFTAAGVVSEATAQAEVVQGNHTPALLASRPAARKTGEITPRRKSARLLASSGKTYRGYRPFPLILGISF